MPTAIENMIDYLTGYGLISKEIPIEIAICRAKEYAKRDGITVTELNERNSVDDGEKSCKHDWVWYTQHTDKCSVCNEIRDGLQT